MPEPIDLRRARDERADRRQLVPCGRCGRDVPMLSTRCPRCGVNFRGAAFQFEYEPTGQVAKTGNGTAILIGAVGIALALAVALLLAR